MKLAMVFPGQGSQSVGMLAGYGDMPVIAQTIAEASEVLGQDLAGLMANGSAETGPATGGGPKAGSREQAYRQLAQAAAVLRQLEPHSPIPYLIQRAVELGSMPFPQFTQAFVRRYKAWTEITHCEIARCS